ncbi:TetR/AcrR family transcriptional regulator [Allosalinactinospora lopnorensis]|uniref:TetR/AcrR family transcriptional regulator n=1 Tax=Allosalinactinospora lopnorensis TaxID=1352348 RepID=UPI00138F330F|nr:TetR/AcrR family transcriptional regulator [Allosalinactinospora lopnorensis]
MSGQHPRERLKEAGTELFFARGFHATSVRDVTEACGLTPGSLYNHFGSKEDLLYSIIMDGHAVLNRSLDAVPADSPPADRLHGLITAFVLHHARSRQEAMVGDEWRSLSAELLEDVRQARLRIRVLVETAIRDGVRSGVFTLPELEGGDSARLAAMAALDMSLRVSGWFRPGDPVADTELARFYADLVVRGVTTPAPAS